jgi:HK97 gp10 family phage protein
MPYQSSNKPPNRSVVATVLRAERTKALTDTARYVRSKAAKYPPKPAGSSYRRTGSLGRSITVGKVTESTGYASVEVGTNIHYAKYVEYGTGIYGPKETPIVPKNAKVLAWRSMGKQAGAGALLIASGVGMRKGKAGHRKAKDVYMNFAYSVKGMKPWHYMEKAFNDPATEAYFKARVRQMAENIKVRLGG